MKAVNIVLEPNKKVQICMQSIQNELLYSSLTKT